MNNLCSGMKYNLISYRIFILMCCFTVMACNQEETMPTSSDSTYMLQLEAGINTQTRAIETGFEINDSIGLYIAKWQDATTPDILRSSGNYTDNASFRLESLTNNWMSGQTIYFPSDDNKVDIYAYYPNRNPLFNSGTTINITVTADQSAYLNYTRSDFMVAKTSGVKRTPGKVQLTFDHKLSQMKFQLKPGVGFTANELLQAKVSVINAITDATYDLSQIPTATPLSGNIREDITPCGSWTTKRDSLVGVMAIVVPQEINATTYIQVSLGNRKFTFKPTSILMRSGCSRTFTITVNNTGLDITTSINPWDTCPAIDGEADEEFDTTDAWEGDTATSFCGGTGTQENPYLICSGSALTYLAAQVNSGNHYTDTYFRVTKNLDLNHLPFTPIGIDRDYHFNGHFDGNGHIVKNLKIQSNTLERIGLFSVLGYNDTTSTPSIENLGVENAHIVANSHKGETVGGIAGEIYGKIENCFFKGQLINNTGETAGGICGYHWGPKAVIKNCYSIIENIETNSGGGINGLVFASGGLIENCYTVIKKWDNSASYMGNITGELKLDSDPIPILQLINNYYDQTICNLAPTGSPQTGITATGKTTTELKLAAMPSQLGGAFKQDANNINEGYPILKWE